MESHLQAHFLEITSDELLDYHARSRAIFTVLSNLMVQFQLPYMLNGGAYEVLAQQLLMQISKFENQGVSSFEMADGLARIFPLIRNSILDPSIDQPLFGSKMNALYEKVSSLKKLMPYGYLILKLALYNSFNRNNIPSVENPYIATQEDYDFFANVLEYEVYTDLRTKKPYVHFSSTFSSIGVRGIDVSRQLRALKLWMANSDIKSSAKTNQQYDNLQAGKIRLSHQQVIDHIERERVSYLEKSKYEKSNNYCSNFLKGL